MKTSHFYAQAPIPELYEWFAGEAAPTSPVWEGVCRWVAKTQPLAARLDALPGAKRQPNLFLAALRYYDAPLEPGPTLQRWVEQNWDTVEALILARGTQTNEPGRCAVLAPVLAGLPQPVSLLEIGASAGLCLYPDAYRYTAESPGNPDTRTPEAPLLLADHQGNPPADPETVQVAARAGIDLNPVDATNPDDVRWLRALVWPGEEEREARLLQALHTVAAHPQRPTILTGDVSDDASAHLDALLALAAPGTTPVILHSATLAYLPDDARAALTASIKAAGAHWLSLEGVAVLPGVRRRLAERDPDGMETYRDRPHFVLALDEEPLARCSPHGGWVHWLAR